MANTTQYISPDQLINDQIALDLGLTKEEVATVNMMREERHRLGFLKDIKRLNLTVVGGYLAKLADDDFDPSFSDFVDYLDDSGYYLIYLSLWDDKSQIDGEIASLFDLAKNFYFTLKNRSN